MTGLLLMAVVSAPVDSEAGASALVLSEQDKVLILAPHPDDEAIGTGGIIQKAVRLNIPLKIVYLTNGENNQLAFLVYKKRPVLGRGLLKMGRLRRREATEAMKYLGVKESQLVFLGYPDFGTLRIFTRYWDSRKPFKSVLSRVNAVPYPDAFAYHSPYRAESILEDLKTILLNYRPTRIFVSLPVDTNPDHQAFYLYLQVALWDLQKKIPEPQVYAYLVHAHGWPGPRGYRPELTLEVPKKLSGPAMTWWTSDLSADEVERKMEAIKFYKSQNTSNPGYLSSFARKNELFGAFNDIILRESPEDIPWENHIAAQTNISHSADEGEVRSRIVQSAAYARRDGKLLIRLVVNNWKAEFSAINIFLLGYKEGEDFSGMPKIRVNINFDRIVTVYNGLNRVSVKDLRLTHEKNVLLLEVPMDALGEPEKILSSVKTYAVDWPLETTAWRTLIVDQNGNSR